MSKVRAAEIVSSTLVSEVWRGLGGGELQHGRGRAFWRDGDGFNVALSDKKGVWFDHVAGAGGGILDLIQKARGCTRMEAMCWLADFAGTPLERVSARERADHARERAGFERDLKTARHWRRTALLMCEETLAVLKAALFDPTAGPPDVQGISSIEQLLGQLRNIGDAVLVNEYRSWRRRDSVLTAAMVRAAEKRNCSERRAWDRFIASPEATGG